MEQITVDVVVIGAGAAGLMAALEIALTGRRVAVMEAKERTGGRILTLAENGLELGAEFVHGNLPLTKHLLQQAGARLVPVKGSIWQSRDGKLGEQEDFIEDYGDLTKKVKQLQGDKPVAQFLQEDLAGDAYKDLRFSLKNYVEGYYAADTQRASTKALCRELTEGEDEQYRIKGGYRQLLHYLEGRCREGGVQFFLSQPVKEIHWQKNEILARTETASFLAKKALITVSVGVLQAGAISFAPALPQVQEAARQLGFGHVLKLVMLFEKPFWKDKAVTDNHDLSDLNFLFSGETIPTWWTQHPQNEAVLTGWLGGPRAEGMQQKTKEEQVQAALHSLSRIFNLDVLHLQQILLRVEVYNWSADPHFCGAYAYEVVNGEAAIGALQQAIADSLYFAGEGLHPGPQIGTVEAALANGRETAHRLVASLAG